MVGGGGDEEPNFDESKRTLCSFQVFLLHDENVRKKEERTNINKKRSYIANNWRYISSSYVLLKKCRDIKCQSINTLLLMCRYEEVEEGKHVGSTNCRKIPVSLCATSACTFVEGPEVCHNKSQVNGYTLLPG
jgi:hypothetical protein